MAVELIIGDKIPVPTPPKSTYQVDLEWMHGDADGETFGKIMFPRDQVEKLKHFLVIYECIEEYSGELNEDLAINCLVAGGLSEEEAEAVIDRFNDATREGDMTNDGSTNAALVGFTVTYWDDAGVQYEVSWNKD